MGTNHYANIKSIFLIKQCDRFEQTQLCPDLTRGLAAMTAVAADRKGRRSRLGGVVIMCEEQACTSSRRWRRETAILRRYRHEKINRSLLILSLLCKERYVSVRRSGIDRWWPGMHPLPHTPPAPASHRQLILRHNGTFLVCATIKIASVISCRRKQCSSSPVSRDIVSPMRKSPLERNKVSPRS